MKVLIAEMDPSQLGWRLGGWGVLVILTLVVLAGRRALGVLGTLYVGATGIAVAVAMQMAGWGGNRLGTALMFGIGAAFAFAAIVAAVLRLGEPVVVVDGADSSSSAPQATKRSLYPLVVAAGLVVAVVGVPLDGIVVLFGAVIVVMGMIGLFAESSAESTLWTDDLSGEVSSRLVSPAVVPIAALAVLLFVALGLSRLLLSTDNDVSLLFAVVASIIIVGGSILVAAAPKHRGLITRVMIGLAVIVVIIAGAVGVARGERAFHPIDASEIPSSVVSADPLELAFDTDLIDVPLGEDGKFELVLNNQNAELFHNISVYTANPLEDAAAEAVFNGPWALPSQALTYYLNFGDVAFINEGDVPVGEYFFRCDIHPNMNGTMVVSQGSQADEAHE